MCVESLLLFIADSYSTEQMDHSVCNQSSPEGHLVSSHLMVITNKDAINIHVQVFV